MLFEASVMHMNYAQEYNIIIIFKQLYIVEPHLSGI